MPDNEGLTPHNVERPDCGHTETLYTRPQQSLADYNFRVVPELRAAIHKPCEQCAKLAQESETKEKEKTGKSK
jgi:hypothetical protein